MREGRALPHIRRRSRNESEATKPRKGRNGVVTIVPPSASGILRLKPIAEKFMISPAIRLSIAALIALTLTFSTAARFKPQSGDEAAIRALVERYFAAHQTRDLDAATRFWSDKSANGAQAKARLKDLFSRNSQIETRGLNVSRFQLEGQSATAVVSIELSGTDAKTGKPAAGLG